MSGKSSLKKIFKKIKFFLKKVLTNRIECVIIYERQGDAGVAQLVEQLICNQQVGGSNPSTSSRLKRGLFKRQPLHMGEFQSGQMGQTVNLLFRLRWFESTLSHQDFEGAVKKQPCKNKKAHNRYHFRLCAFCGIISL